MITTPKQVKTLSNSMAPTKGEGIPAGISTHKLEVDFLKEAARDRSDNRFKNIRHHELISVYSTLVG